MFRKDLFSDDKTFTNNKNYWTSYEDYCQSPEVEAIVQGEFPVDASIFSDSLSRRNFFKIMGASLALAGLQACKFSPAAQIISFVKAPDGLIPGKSVFYARSLNRGGYGVGVLVESFMGRPIKIEGNPEHPMSLGASDIFLQADILNLYDPDRLQKPFKGANESSWSTFEKEWSQRAMLHSEDKGSGLRILFERNSSETFNDQLKLIQTRYPQAKIISFDPISRELLREATKLTFAQYLEPIYDFSKAQVILTLDRDFLSDEAAGIRHSRDFSDKRRIKSTNSEMNRLYAIESDFTTTGSMADHRLARSRFELENLILKLSQKIGIQFENKNLEIPITTYEENWLNSAVADLTKHSGASLIIASETLKPEYQSLVLQMNEKLKNFDKTITFIKTAKNSDEQESRNLKNLVEDMNKGAVTSLFILSLNPVYANPNDLNFSKALKKVPFSVCLCPLKNETSKECTWALPECHALENWSDSRSIDGTLSINQPLIAPLFNSYNSLEVLSIISQDHKALAHQLIKDYWSKKQSPLTFDSWWEEALSLGFVRDSKSLPINVKTKKNLNKNIFKVATNNLELHFKADPTIRDGKFANNGWLQELPKPMTKICWSNAALVSPDLATKNGLQNGNEITLKTAASTLDIPVWILPGLARNIIVIHYGHGRKESGRVGTNIGSDSYQLLHSNNVDGIEREISFIKNSKTKELACTQQHHSYESREPLKVYDFKNYDSLKKEKTQHESLYKEAPITPSTNYAWGMSIDLNVCTGCNACVIGCQAENNIPIVGEAQVILGREMHWIRLDRYFEGTPDFAKAYFQPLACVHCEKAPCEVVCPVAATVHSNEGLNEMVYNRCVGTRYCSNNCPYKVRRFNFLEYHRRESQFLKMQSNPEVTVRTKGVMEKCTYCIQRINEARINSDGEGRKIRDGEIKTACQQACSSNAIVFGNLLDKNSEVSRLQNSVQSYSLLDELGTIPRTQYLARFRNSNPEILE
jgi:MoCo/4Fe-4S cofactor protein with predicted Tat translocation signal